MAMESSISSLQSPLLGRQSGGVAEWRITLQSGKGKVFRTTVVGQRQDGEGYLISGDSAEMVAVKFEENGSEVKILHDGTWKLWKDFLAGGEWKHYNEESGPRKLKLCVRKLGFGDLAYHWAILVYPEDEDGAVKGGWIYQVDNMSGVGPMIINNINLEQDLDLMDGWYGITDLPGTTTMPHGEIVEFIARWRHKYPTYWFIPGPCWGANCQTFVANLYKELTGQDFPYHKDSLFIASMLSIATAGAAVGIGLSVTAGAAVAITASTTLSLGYAGRRMLRSCPQHDETNWTCQCGEKDPVLKGERKQVKFSTLEGEWLQVTPEGNIRISKEAHGWENLLQLKQKSNDHCYLKSDRDSKTNQFISVTPLEGRFKGMVKGCCPKAAAWELFDIIENDSDCQLVKLKSAAHETYLHIVSGDSRSDSAKTLRAVAEKSEATEFVRTLVTP